jgi:hypothetical protein
MTDTDHLPPERTLSPRRRDQILRSVLSGEEPAMSRRRRVRWVAPLAVAAVAALIAVGAVALSDHDGEQSGGTSPSRVVTEATVPLDLGPLTEAEAEDVFAHAFASETDGVSLHYTRRIDGPTGPISVLLGRADNGVTVFATDHLSGVPEIPEPTAAEPIRGLDKQWGPNIGDAIYVDLPEYWKLGGVYRVADTVDRVEVRVGTPNGQEPWRVAEPYNGFVFWAVWFAFADYEPGTELTVEWRAYDTEGEQIDPTQLPDQPQTVIVPEG